MVFFFLFQNWLKPGGQCVVAGFFLGRDCEEAQTFVSGFGWPPLCTVDAFVKVCNRTHIMGGYPVIIGNSNLYSCLCMFRHTFLMIVAIRAA